MVIRQAFQSKVNQGFAQRYLETKKKIQATVWSNVSSIPQINPTNNCSSSSSAVPGTCPLYNQVWCFGQHQLLECALLQTPVGHKVSHHLALSLPNQATKGSTPSILNTIYYKAYHLFVPSAFDLYRWPPEKKKQSQASESTTFK